MGGPLRRRSLAASNTADGLPPPRPRMPARALQCSARAPHARVPCESIPWQANTLPARLTRFAPSAHPKTPHGGRAGAECRRVTGGHLPHRILALRPSGADTRAPTSAAPAATCLPAGHMRGATRRPPAAAQGGARLLSRAAAEGLSRLGSGSRQQQRSRTRPPHAVPL